MEHRPKDQHSMEPPRPKYLVPQEELEEVPTTDPDARHLDPALIRDKPVGRTG